MVAGIPCSLHSDWYSKDMVADMSLYICIDLVDSCLLQELIGYHFLFMCSMIIKTVYVYYMQ